MNLRAMQMLAVAMLCVMSGARAAAPVRVAWLHEGELVGLQRIGTHNEPTPAALRTPLGSVWKLFVYAYLVESNSEEPAYRCAAIQRKADDEYCCEPAASVGRDDAIAQSCGPYFEISRLGISQERWARFWQQRDAPRWLQQANSMRPDNEVDVADLLHALERVPTTARIAARKALLPNNLRDETVLAAIGSGPRFKTWSWHIAADRAGGAAGWLADGTPFWFSAPGTSRSALNEQAKWIAAQWSAAGLGAARAEAAIVSAEPCVDVDFFKRYPIVSVRHKDGNDAGLGPMTGRYVVAFENGTQLPIDAVPALTLSRDAKGSFITARLPLEDYVARVVDREGNAREVSAARALAVAARTYVLQNSIETEGCRRIADDSHAQRVSPNPPSDAAQAAAAFTQELVVNGALVRYHSNQASAGVLSWKAAVASSQLGASFDAILREAYPRTSLGALQAGLDCEPVPQAEHWLVQRQKRWRQVLNAQPGFDPPGASLQVCQLAMGTPHSDQRRMLIRVREWQTREGRVSLIHEYLHLAFRNYPKGQDEEFVEQLAQRLVDL